MRGKITEIGGSLCFRVVTMVTVVDFSACLFVALRFLLASVAKLLAGALLLRLEDIFEGGEEID